MKVYEQSGYQCKATPVIMLKGQWLRKLGFEEGTPITVHCEDGILTITRMDEVDCEDVPEYRETQSKSSLSMVAKPVQKYGKR